MSYGKQVNQLSFFQDVSKNNITPFRPIHYLGSKLRIVDQIKEVIDELDPSYSRVWDLFSGSGTVSQFLSKTRPVTAVDIQEYSRVLTSSVLMPLNHKYDINEIILECKSSEHYKKLMWCLSPLIESEEKSFKKAQSNELIDICRLIELSPILKFEEENNDLSLFDNAFKKSLERLRASDFIEGPEALTTRYYGGAYFSYKQAVQVDVLLEYISNLDARDKDIFLAATLSTASEIVNTVGKQFAQPLKTFDSNGNPKDNLIVKILKERNLNVFEIFEKKLESFFELNKTEFAHKTYRMDYADALERLDGDTKVVYADPPYTRYHYSRYYHVLETLCLRDNPNISRVKINGQEKVSRGIYREDRHQSSFSIKSKSHDAFNTLFRKVSQNNASLVLSYSPFNEGQKNAPRIHKINELKLLGEKYFNSVEILSIGNFSHSKLNKIEKNFEPNLDSEILIVCKN